MFLFYVDESGAPRSHDEPLREGQTPIFVLASLGFPGDRWRAVDRAYLAMKARFFSPEIGDRRPEYYEAKGTNLVGPHNRGSRRRHAFVRQAMQLCIDNQAKGFAVIFKKNPNNPIPANSMYTMALQYLVERFNCFLEETAEGHSVGFQQEDAQGIIVADSRMNNLDLNVAISHLSFIFGNPVGQRCDRLIEAPTFTFSQLSVGLQLTDIFASCIYAQSYRRHIQGIPGCVDYSHMVYVVEYLNNLEFRSTQAYDGHFVRGYRFIDFSGSA